MDEIDAEYAEYRTRMESPSPYGQVTVDGRTYYIYRIVHPNGAVDYQGFYETRSGFGIAPGKDVGDVLKGMMGKKSLPMSTKTATKHAALGDKVILLHDISDVKPYFQSLKDPEVPGTGPPPPPPPQARDTCPVAMWLVPVIGIMTVAFFLLTLV